MRERFLGRSDAGAELGGVTGVSRCGWGQVLRGSVGGVDAIELGRGSPTGHGKEFYFSPMAMGSH